MDEDELEKINFHTKIIKKEGKKSPSKTFFMY